MSTRIARVEERLELSKRKVETGRVTLRKSTAERVEHIDPVLLGEAVDIERIKVNREVDAPVAVRREGDTTIVSVHAEVLVKRLVVVEELHIRMRSTAVRKPQDVVLRAEQIHVERQTVAKPSRPRPRKKAPPA